jgi:cohesin complex subunit SA-1/2
MSVSNDTKLAELDETVFNSLRDAIDGDDVFSMSMSEDRLATLEAILLRVSLLGRSRDITEVMEDEEGGQSSGWDIICAFAERGEVGYKEEAKVSSRGSDSQCMIANSV